MLCGRQLRKSFGEETVLDGVSLEIVGGTVTAIIGPSGGGKSTLLRILAQLDTPDAGYVTIDGTRMGSRAAGKIWPDLTLVFQQQFLWPHLTFAQNLALPLRGRDRNRALEQELLEELEVAHLLGRRPWQLSVGERARAALVRALLLSPRFLLLDEITAALDSERCEIVGRLLRRFADSGRAVLLATHDLGFLAQVADQCLRLERGKLHPVPALFPGGQRRASAEQTFAG